MLASCRNHTMLCLELHVVIVTMYSASFWKVYTSRDCVNVFLSASEEWPPLAFHASRILWVEGCFVTLVTKCIGYASMLCSDCYRCMYASCTSLLSKDCFQALKNSVSQSYQSSSGKSTTFQMNSMLPKTFLPIPFQ